MGTLREAKASGLVLSISWPHGRPYVSAWILNFRGLASWKWLEARCRIIELPRKPRPQHHVRLRWSWSVIEQIIYIYKDLPIGGFRILGGCGQIMDHDHVGTVVLGIWLWWQPFFSSFVYATELYTSPSGGLYRIVCLPEWCIIEFRLPNYYDPPIIMTPKICFYLFMDIIILLSCILFRISEW